jgi:hypothetical protein
MEGGYPSRDTLVPMSKEQAMVSRCGRVIVFVLLLAVLLVDEGGFAASTERADTTPRQATPTAAVAPTECRVEPRAIPLYEALALLPTGTPSPDDDRRDPTATIPAGPPADATTVAAATATMREYIACQNAGDYRRQFALVTDEYLRGFFSLVAEVAIGLRMPPALAVLTFTAGEPLPRAEQVRITIEAIEDVRVLPDGRVAAAVVFRDPTREPEISTDVAIFEQVKGRWLLDGGLDLPTAAITGALEP